MSPATTESSSARQRALRELARRTAKIEWAKRDFAEFSRQAIAAGVVEGVKRVEWGPHLEGYCFSLQCQLEAWLVAHGYGTEEMIARQREAWERTEAVWEDGEPEPWLRYVLTQNQIDNLPPGTLKSTLAMVLANAWIWLWCSTFAFGATSGMEPNVDRDARATRYLVRSRWYRETFAIAWTTFDIEAEEIGIKRDADAVGDWATTAGGKRISRTISSGFTGTHVDCTFIDDPDDADKVWFEAERIKPQNRFTRAIENRINCENRSLRRVLQQRVHVDDFTAYLLSIAVWSPANPKGWAWLCIPAEFGKGPKEAPVVTPYGWRDWRTTPGEVLHSRLSPGVLADKRQKMPGYEGQYNQSPNRLGVGMFLAKHARFFVLDDMPALARRRPEGCRQAAEAPPVMVKRKDLRKLTLSVDAANSLDPKPGAKVSAVGLVVGACLGDLRLILEDATRVLGVSGTYRAIYELILKWEPEVVLVELKALGAGVISELERALRRGWYLDPNTDKRVELNGRNGKRITCKVKAVKVDGKESKVQRAHAFVPAWDRGEILLLDGADWLYAQVDEGMKTVDEGLLGEVCSFPASRRSDRVDAIGQFVAEYRTDGDPREKMRREVEAMQRLAGVPGGLTSN